MRYTEKWTWQKQDKVPLNTFFSDFSGSGRRSYTYIHSTAWMQTYRERIRAIDTDEKASVAIRTYWHEVAREWDDGRGII